MRSAGDSGEATTRPEPRLPERYGTTGNLKKKWSCGARCFSSWDWIGRTDSVLEALVATHGNLRPLVATREKGPLAATRQKRPLAATRQKRRFAATCGRSSGCKWVQVAVFPNFKYHAFLWPQCKLSSTIGNSLRTWRFYCLWYVHNTMDHSSDLQSLDTERTLSCLISTIHSSNNIWW